MAGWQEADTMTPGRLGTILFAVVFLLRAPLAIASGTGILTFGNPVPAAPGWEGHRELVRLDKSGNLLWGKPVSATPLLITLRLREPASAGQLVLWERKQDDGSIWLNLSVPPNLKDRLAGITLFLRNSGAEPRLLYERHGAWAEQAAETISLGDARSGGPETDTVSAFPADEAGLFVIRYGASKAGPVPRPGEVNPFEVRARIARAGWHFFCPATVLVSLWLISRKLHSRGSRWTR